MYKQLKIINDSDKQNQIKSGEEMAINFGTGLKNKKSWLQTTWENVNPNNRMSQKEPTDTERYFGDNIKSNSNVNQKIISNITINNTSSSYLDLYSLAHITSDAIEKEFSNLKGLGTQYNWGKKWLTK